MTDEELEAFYDLVHTAAVFAQTHHIGQTYYVGSYAIEAWQDLAQQLDKNVPAFVAYARGIKAQAEALQEQK
jgi:hypothetical protein